MALPPRVVIDRVAEGDHARDEGDAEQRVQGAVEDVPEADVVAADLPELGALVGDEAEGHEVEDALDDVEVAARVDGVDGGGVEDEVEEREEDLDGVLVQGRAHPVRVEVRPEIGVGFAVPGDEVGRVRIVLDEPAAPEVGDAFLVARGADDTQGVEVDGALDGVGGFGGRGGDEDGVAF